MASPRIDYQITLLNHHKEKKTYQLALPYKHCKHFMDTRIKLTKKHQRYSKEASFKL